MKKVIRDFFYKMKISRFLFYLFILFSVLDIESVCSQEDVEIQTWAGFQGLNVLSVGAVADDCKKIFDSCRSDSQKMIDDLTKLVKNTQDGGAAVPPKLWDALSQITDILQNAPKSVRFHFAELGDHFLKKLSGTINTAKSINFDKLQDLQSIYNSGVDPNNELVLKLEKSFSVNYNPNSALQQTLPESLKQSSYSPSVALYELKHLSKAVTEEIDNIEKAALKLLNKIHQGIAMTKELSFSLKKTGTYPSKYDEQYVKNSLQNCSFLAKALKPDSVVSQPVSTTPAEPDSDPVIPSMCDDTPVGNDTGCGEIFRKSEKKIMQQLILTIREIEPIDDKKEIDSRIFKIFKNYSLVLSNLNKKVITNVIKVVNQFFQLYNIVLSILDKINPDMKHKAELLLYIQDVDTTDTNYENVNKFIVEDYLSSSKMNELLERLDVHIKSMKSLTQIKKGIKQELTVITTELGVDLQTFKSTIFNVFDELKKGVKALQNLKNKSNRTGFRYYLNFYRGKADLAQLRKLMCIINSLKIEFLLERQMFTDDEELQDFKDATTNVQKEIDERYQKLMKELNSMNDFNFVQGFVSRSVLGYNLSLESYTVQSRTILKKVITKYVTIFEELIIIIKRRKIKNYKTMEDLYLDQRSVSTYQDETVKKYLLDKTDIDIEKSYKTLNQEINIQNKETITQEISELNTVTHSEVTKINQTVLKLINTMSTEIQNLKTIKDEASQTLDYEISEDKLKCILNIIQIIESLQIRSNKEEIQSLSIYFERVKENIQMASQTFETQTSEYTEIQQFKSEVETLKKTIFESLTRASLEVNEKIRRVLFEYNEKVFVLRQNRLCSELNSLQGQDSTFKLNDYTRKYITGYYTSDEFFTTLDTVMSSSTSSNISNLKTEMYAKLDETNQNIESELEMIHDDLNNFVDKFSEGMTVLSDLESNLQKETNQSVTIDATQLSTLKTVEGMVNVIGKYVNVNAESSQRELKMQIDNARLQISTQFEQVSQSVTSTNDYRKIESIMTQSVSSCESIYNELKKNTRYELSRSVEEFLNSYQKTVNTIHSQVSSSNSQTTILQDLNKGDCTTEDSEFQNFMQSMIEQDYQSLTTVFNTFEYMKKYNFADSQTMREKCSEVFQSLSNKMNIEIDNISSVSKYVLENVQKANNVLIKLENCENKQSVNVSFTDEELREFRIARSVNELWKYSLQDTTISSISTIIVNARSEMDLEYRKIQAKLESSTDQNIEQTEIETSLQNIQKIYETTQSETNKIIKQDVEYFYNSMTKEINELQSSSSSTLNTALQSVISNRNVSLADQQQNSSTNVDFNSFTSKINIQQVYNEIKTKTTQNSSQIIENFKHVINEKFNKIEKTSAYVVANVRKGYSVMEEIKSSLQLESNYQLTQYQGDQLKKCVKVSHKVGNLKVDAKTAQTTITNNINSVKNQIREEYTKINESVSSLTDEKSVQETVSKGVNKFEQLYAQAKDIVKEQLFLASSGFYSSYMNSINNLESQNSSQVYKMMRDIENDVGSYQSSSDQSFMDAVSYFNSKSFKSCLSVKNWYHSIQSTTSVETFSTVNEKYIKELSSLNDNITTSFDKMESSSTYVLQSVEKSSEFLISIEESVKQDATYQLTEEQITEFQKCISIYKSIQTVTTTSTSNAQESIQTNINEVKSKVSSTYAEITQSISSCTDENSIKEVSTKGVQKFEKIFSEAKESIKEELFQSFNSFYNSFTQITTDSKSEFSQISSTLQSLKSNTNTYQSDDHSYQETVSYFNSETFKSYFTVKNWFNEISTSSSSITSSNMQENTINQFSSVNEKIHSSLNQLETSSSFILQTIENSSQIFKQIETSMIQGTAYELRQEQITQLQKCMSIYQSVESTITSTSTFITQQKIQADVKNVKEELTNAYSQITQSISSCSDDHSIRQVETKGIDNYKQIFSQATETIKEQLTHKSSDFYSMFTQLTTDMKQESMQQNVVTSETVTQSETDQLSSATTTCFTSMFKSTNIVKNWYSEIKKTTSESDWSVLSGGVGGKVTSDFGTLNDKVTKSVDSMQESSIHLLDTMKKGFDTIKQVKECMMQDSNYKLTQEQVTYLQKCVSIHQTIQTAMTTTSTSSTTEAKQTMESDITSMKSLINDEFNKAFEAIESLTDETSINEAVTKNVDNMDKFFSETKGKIASVLSDSSSTFYGTYQKLSSMFEKKENSQMKQVLSDIVNNKISYQYQNDQSFSNIISYFNDSSSSYKSTSTIHNWYNEITSSSSTTQSSSFSRNTINNLSNLNEQVTKSIISIQENSSSIVDIIEKGSEILEQIEESTIQNSNYQLNQDQITYLQKCIAIHQTIQSVTTTTSTTVSNVKQTISSDISDVKSKISGEYAKVSESLKSINDDTKIKQVVDDHVSKVDQYYSETKQKVQIELNQASSEYFSNYQQITSCLNKDDIRSLQDIISGKNTYQAASDNTFSKMVSYLNSDSFKLNYSMQNWYKEIHSKSTQESTVSDCTIKEMGILNEWVTRSIDSMEECSNYVLDSIDRGSSVIRQIQQSTKENTDYHLSQIQITELQKTFSIYQTIQSVTTSATSTTVSTAKKTISTDISNVKTEIADEYAKASKSLKSLTDETSVKQVVDENVSKVNQCFSKTKQKVQTELNQVSSDFFNNYQQITSSLNKEDVNTLQDIVSGKNTYQASSDQTYLKMVSYLNSDTFKSNCLMQDWYKEIHSSSPANQSSEPDCAIEELGMLNDRVTESIDLMEECSNYVLDTFNKGSEVVKQIQQSTKESNNYHLSRIEITELQKTISIHQIIQSVTTTVKSATTINAGQTITSEVSNVKTQINEENKKVTESIRFLSDEGSIKQVVDDHVFKVEQYYSQVKDKVQRELTNSSSNFFSELQDFSSTSNTQSKSKSITVIQDIANGKNTYQVDDDQSFKNVITYLNSNSFKSNKIIQNIYQTIQSDTTTSTSTNYSEKAVNNLNTFSNDVSQSVDSMEENSKYVLDTMNKGLQVIQQIKEYTKKDSNYKITQDQVTILQKCITIYQIIQNTSNTATSTTTDISKNEKTFNTDQNISQTSDISQNSEASHVGRSIAHTFGLVSENKDETIQHSSKDEFSVTNETADLANTGITSDTKTCDSISDSKDENSSNTDQNINQTSDNSQNSDASHVGRSIAHTFGLFGPVSENEDGKTQHSNKKESSVTDETSDSTNQFTQQASADMSKVNITGDAKTYDSTSNSKDEKSFNTDQNIRQSSDTIQNSEVTHAGRSIADTFDMVGENKDEKSSNTEQNISQTSDTSQNSEVSHAGRSIPDTFDMVGENKNEISSNTDQNISQTSNTSQNSEVSHAGRSIADMVGENKDKKSSNTDQNISQTSDTSQNSEVSHAGRWITHTFDMVGENKDEKSSNTKQNISQTSDTSQNSEVSHAGRSIPDTFDMVGENKNEISSNTDQNISQTSNTSQNSEVTHAGRSIADTFDMVGENKDEKSSNIDQSISQTSDTSQNSEVTHAGRSIADTFDMVGENRYEKSSNTDQNISQTSDTSQNSEVSHAGRWITHTFDMVGENKDEKSSNTEQNISQTSDTSQNSEVSHAGRSIPDTFDMVGENKDENIQVSSKEESSVTDKTADSTNQFTQQSSANVGKVNITGDAETYDSSSVLKGENNSNTDQKINQTSDTHQNSVVSNFGNSIADTFDFGSESKNEKTNVESSVTDKTTDSTNQISQPSSSDVDKANITGDVETCDSTSISNSQGKINSSVTNAVKNNSVSDHSVKSDDEYEYEIEAIKNTREVVQVEETMQEEEKVAVDKKYTVNSNLTDTSKMQTSDKKKVVANSSSTSVPNIDYKDDDQSKKISALSSDSASNDSEKLKSIDTKVNGDASTTKSKISSSDSMPQDSIENKSNPKKTKVQSTKVVSTKKSTAQKTTKNISSSQTVKSTAPSINQQSDVKSNASSTTNENSTSKKNEKKVNKIDKLKKFTKDEGTCSKTSLTTLMVNWTVTKSTTTGVPNTCASLTWDKYYKPDDDENIIKEIADLLAVGRTVIEDSIELKKEKLPLYRDADDIEMLIVRSTDIVDEVLLQLSEIVGQDVQTLKESFSDSMNMNLGPDAATILSDKISTLDKEFLSAASTFFSMKSSKKTDLLYQINKQFKNVQIEDDKRAKEIATKQFDKLQSIMKTVLDNIDCLLLRVVDVIENAKHSTTCAKNDENCSIYVKNGQVLCDTVKIPVSD